MGPVVELISLFDGILHNATGFFLVTLGVLVSIRFAGFPDLTVDGSFTFGAALYAVGVQHNLPVVVCLALAWLAGATAGLLTALVNRALGIGKIISSILIMLFLITVIPYITGGAAVGLLNERNWLASVQAWDLRVTRAMFPQSAFSLHPGFILIWTVVGSAAVAFVRLLFTARLGLQLRYLGSAQSPMILTGRQQKYLMFFGLSLGNSLVGLGGAVEAERSGGFSQNMGLGVILISLACLVLGESILKTVVRRDQLLVREYLLAVFLGVVGYSLVLKLLLFAGLTFLDVRLTTTLFLLVLLAIAARYHPSTGRLF